MHGSHVSVFCVPFIPKEVGRAPFVSLVVMVCLHIEYNAALLQHYNAALLHTLWQVIVLHWQLNDSWGMPGMCLDLS